MKHCLIVLAMISLAALSENTETFVVDLKQSNVVWHGYYVFSFSEHYGSIKISKGAFQWENQQIKGGYFEMDMKSILDLDMPADDGGNDLSNHLKNDDFFSTEKFPKAYFEISRIEKIGNSTENSPNYDIIGKFTLKGVTNELKFPALVTFYEKEIRAKAKFKFDRTKWGVRYNSGKFFSDVGDGAISDAIGIDLELVAIKE
jgi:polyisoprenoid-binding protein YceI